MTTTDQPDPLAAYAATKLWDHLSQIERCAGLLSDRQLWFRPNENSNSIANLLLHLRGNVGQWVLSGIGGRPCDRDRPGEFARREGPTKDDLVRPLQEVVRASCELLGCAAGPRLQAEYTIQGYQVTGYEAVLHVVEHFAFHTGQIVSITKWLLDVDLSLYDDQGRRIDGRRSGAP
jgi:uncharacterized damage-inducible protein DinB